MEDLILHKKIFWIRITEKVMLLTYAFALFAIPLLISWPQLLVGSMVNFILILAALHYKNYKTMLPLVILPSIAAVLHGVMFWPFSVFLVYMMPAIRIGNFILTSTIQHDTHMLKWILTGWLYKAVFLSIIASLLIYFWILPVIFLKAMGLFQLISVLIWWTVMIISKQLRTIYNK